jgi:hypothetical protein
MRADEFVAEQKVRLDPKCWTGKKIGSPKTKLKGGMRVNNCVPVEEGAVEDLEKDLDQPDSYSAIDHMMQTIARDYNITGKQLHDLFVAKHGVIPDKWTREQLKELSFLGSECTKDCSGHRAGYNWSHRKGLKQGNSPYSPSFNKGAALAVQGL